MVDWLEALREQGEIAQRLATSVPKVLGDPKLTLEQASKLYGMVERGAQDFDRFAELMDEHDLDDSFYEAAESLQELWSQLSVASANKVRTMQGLEPIPFPDDEYED